MFTPSRLKLTAFLLPLALVACGGSSGSPASRPAPSHRASPAPSSSPNLAAAKCLPADTPLDQVKDPAVKAAWTPMGVNLVPSCEHLFGGWKEPAIDNRSNTLTDAQAKHKVDDYMHTYAAVLWAEAHGSAKLFTEAADMSNIGDDYARLIAGTKITFQPNECGLPLKATILPITLAQATELTATTTDGYALVMKYRSDCQTETYTPMSGPVTKLDFKNSVNDTEVTVSRPQYSNILGDIYYAEVSLGGQNAPPLAQVLIRQTQQ